MLLIRSLKFTSYIVICAVNYAAWQISTLGLTATHTQGEPTRLLLCPIPFLSPWEQSNDLSCKTECASCWILCEWNQVEYKSVTLGHFHVVWYFLEINLQKMVSNGLMVIYSHQSSVFELQEYLGKYSFWLNLCMLPNITFSFYLRSGFFLSFFFLFFFFFLLFLSQLFW